MENANKVSINPLKGQAVTQMLHAITFSQTLLIVSENWKGFDSTLVSSSTQCVLVSVQTVLTATGQALFSQVSCWRHEDRVAKQASCWSTDRLLNGRAGGGLEGKLGLYTSTMHKCIKSHLTRRSPPWGILGTDTLRIFIGQCQQLCF